MKSFLEFLNEGVYDKGIFKVIFLAGGPGSGKTFVTNKITAGHPFRLINSDNEFERLMAAANLSFKMPPEEKEKRDIERDKAKKMTDMRMKNYIHGRLGLFIDGTGREYEKIERQVKELKNLGYDAYMVFVNTSLNVALERNSKRTRSVPEDIATKSWNEVQNNIGKFQNLFGQSNFIIIDNNNASEDILNSSWKMVKKIVDRPLQNNTAKKWIESELQKKKR